ncbi:MAG: protein kinase, partial [Myxococcota bacterium]
MSDDAETLDARAPQPAGAPPKRLGRYRVRGVLGRGAMGVVYDAVDPQLDRPVAVKVIRAGAHVDAMARARLAREARSLAKLSHPNVVQVHDAGEAPSPDGPQVFIAMERVDGEDLARHLDRLRKSARWRQGRAVDEILALFLPAGEGLAAAHAQGLVHRDFKPANVLVARDGRVLVGDFGLARPADATTPVAPPSAVALLGSDTTAFAGTPGFIAPETYRGELPGAKIDQYAFCVSLYAALYGARPIRADTAAALAQATLLGRIRSPASAPPVPPRVARVLRRGLATEPDERFPDMHALLAALRSSRAQPKRLRRAALAALAVLGGGALAFGAGLSAAPGDTRCAAKAARLDAVWNAERRDRLGARIAAVPVPYAAQLWVQVAPRLDGYAAKWRAERVASCEAELTPEPPPLLESRNACLARRLGVLSAYLDALETPDPGSVAASLRGAGALPDPARCADPAFLATLAEVTEPPEPVAARVGALFPMLDAARAEGQAGRVDAALAAAREAELEARGLGHAPLDAEAALVRGELEMRRGLFGDASDSLHRAYVAARAGGAELPAAKAAMALTRVVGVERGRGEQGLYWAELADASLARLGPDPALRNRARLARASVLHELGQRAEAMELVREVQGQLEGPPPAPPLELAPALRLEGELLLRSRDYHGALRVLAGLDSTLRRVLGDAHPDRLAVSVLMASAQIGVREFDAARATLEEVFRLGEQTLPPKHPVRADALLRKAGYLTQLRPQTGYDAALAVYDEALEVTRAVYGPGHNRVARVLLNRASALARAGRREEAIAGWREALALREALFGVEHPDLAVILQNIGATLTEDGDFDAALEV